MQSTKILCAALLVGGCVGQITEPGGEDGPGGSPEGKAATGIGVAHVPLRRLTREQYDNTVRDLLGDTTRPASSFPPDEDTGGFEANNVAPVSALGVKRYMDAAEALASAALQRVDVLAPCGEGVDEAGCAAEFIARFGRLAFRRPLAEDETVAFNAIYADKRGRSEYASAIGLVVEALLQSPQFLYRVEGPVEPGQAKRALDGFEIATRLAYFVWASAPDEALLDAAEDGRLAKIEGIEAEAKRLFGDQRARDGIRSFHRQWLGLSKLDTLSKDASLFPSFTPELVEAMREETLLFSEHVGLQGGDSLTALLTSQESYVNAPLAALYGVPAPGEEGFALTALPPGQRSGVLTHASVMSVHAKAEQTSPILRGKFVREKLLCQAIKPPPPTVDVTVPAVDPKLSAKDRFAQHQTDPVCAGCHRWMDPIGFGFEHYDAMGAWRDMDGELPVDAVGELTDTDVDGSFDGVVELGKRLASSDQVRRCVATQWLRYALGRVEDPEEEPAVAAIVDRYQARGFDMRELLIAIVTSTAFRSAAPKAGGAP